MTKTILVLSGGGPAPTTPLPDADFVVAADSGWSLAAPLGLTVDLVVGDLDSIADADAPRRARVPVEAHPADKDATDLELALEAALAREATRICVVGGGAGRLDHLLGLALLLTDDRWAGVTVEWHAGRSVAHVVRGRAVIPTAPGDVVSVIPADDAVVTIEGARWGLDRTAMRRGTTRGVSNEATDDQVTISADAGVVMVIVTRGDDA